MSAAANLSRFEDLLSRYLDEKLTDSDAAEFMALLAEPQLTARFLEMTRLNSEIAGLLSAPVPDAAMVELVQADIEKHLAEAGPSTGMQLRIADRPQSVKARPPTPVLTPRPRPARRKVAVRVFAWAALFVALAGLAILFLNHPRPFDAPVVTSTQGDVRLLGSTGEQALAAPESWARGATLKTLGPKSTATLTFSDGSRLDLTENCIAHNQSTKEGRRVELEHGSIQAAVTTQPKGKPFVFATSEAEAIVVGTTLRLVSGAHHTRLEVTEGEVRFLRLHDGAEIAVKAGHFAVVAPNAPFAPTPLHADPHAVHQPQ